MSLSLPFDGVLEQASSIVNGLWGAYLVPIGLGLGFSVLGFIVKSVRSAI
jgi:hypothetical protein